MRNLLNLFPKNKHIFLNKNRKFVRIQYPDVQIPGTNTTDKGMVHFDEISLKTVCRHATGEDIQDIKFDPVTFFIILRL